jgi:hypothetical protein
VTWRHRWENLPSGDDYKTMVLVADAYRQQFGQVPPIWDFLRSPVALASELVAAMARGEPVTTEDLKHRLALVRQQPIVEGAP